MVSSLVCAKLTAVPLVAVIVRQAGETSGCLVEEWRLLGIDARLLTPEEAVVSLGAGDLAIIRLDVLPTLDGVEAGLEQAGRLEAQGVRVLNPPTALLGTHDKLETNRLLEQAGLPHPAAVHLTTTATRPPLEPPFVVKPRFGSWGRDVFRCRDWPGFERCLDTVGKRPWFRHHGALVQELVPPRLFDLRLVAAGGRIVGAAERRAAPGEWRTNISLGGSLHEVELTQAAIALGESAVAAVGADLVGIDLLPLPAGGYTVLELNGAADFDGRYSLPGRDVYADIARAIGFARTPARPALPLAPPTEAGAGRAIR
jgi:RimK family alpha-L-glutamate ligase